MLEISFPSKKKKKLLISALRNLSFGRDETRLCITAIVGVTVEVFLELILGSNFHLFSVKL